MRRYGSGLNFDSGTYETYHQFAVNEPFKADCRREGNRNIRLARKANEKILVVTVADEGIPDPKGRTPCVYLRNPQKRTLEAFLSAEDNSITRVQSSAIRKALEGSEIFSDQVTLREVR